MRTVTLSKRIIRQLRHDKRTLALVMFVPVLVLSLVYFILNDDNITYRVALDGRDQDFESELLDNDMINLKIVDAKGTPREMIDDGCIAVVEYNGRDKPLRIWLDGSDAGAIRKTEVAVTAAFVNVNRQYMLDCLPPGIEIEKPEVDTKYVYGSAEDSSFDNFGIPLIGIIVFFFVYLIAGINFLGERRSGTLERMLSTPIRRFEIVLGYTIGFFVLALIQTTIITLYSIYMLNLSVNGSILLVLLVTSLTAVTALTLGILLSTLANSEFQMVQFIPIVIIPQVFLCGLFKLSAGWSTVSKFVPLYYTTDALRKVMVKGAGLETIGRDVLLLFGLSVFFIMVNILALKRQRRI